MKHFLIFSLLCTVCCSKERETSSSLLDGASDGDINAVRLRLAEERERCLLLENDVQILTLRYAQLQRMMNQAMSPVGFVAKLSDHTTIRNGEVLKLDKVEMNEGNSYNPTLGVFRAPVRGMYMLSITAMTQEGYPVHIVLMNGHKELTRLFPGTLLVVEWLGWCQFLQFFLKMTISSSKLFKCMQDFTDITLHPFLEYSFKEWLNKSRYIIQEEFVGVNKCRLTNFCFQYDS